ncbi:MAG: peptidoglycan DD-metalloendopeptidase family protein [bacterium]|nr:peptidoglycan DD-metalloendopeptidase family protein [bacterium]
MSILQSNLSPASIFYDKKAKDDKSSEKDTKIDENEKIDISNNALVPATSGQSKSSNETEFDFDQISVYVVRSGDTIAQIADLFDVSPNTIIWANDLKKGEKLKKDETLIILPVSGVKHTVLKGQTLKGIAKLYKINVADITSYNNIDEDQKLVVGAEIILPGAEIEVETIAPKKKTTSYYADNSKSSSGGYFIKPIPCGLTQNKHDKYAVDMSCGAGTPIKAAASGKILFAKYGWNGAFGNLIIIAHPNGTQTFYAHQSKLAVSQGDNVAQGQIIGYVGNTGRSTGPHLHFEVRGAKNPGFDNSWAKQ